MLAKHCVHENDQKIQHTCNLRGGECLGTMRDFDGMTLFSFSECKFYQKVVA